MPRPIHAVIVVGATGVGKSKWALEYAIQHGGTIVNADSQQFYRAIPILTAQPSAEDKAQCPHLGYGILEPDQRTSVGWWLKQVAEYVTQVECPVIVGGTGMYVDALLRGLSDIPNVEDDVLEKVEKIAQKPNWQDWVKKIDPTLPATMQDPQRLKRALGVLMQTGQSITEFWKNTTYAVPNLRAHVVVVDMPVNALVPRLEQRFLGMLDAGALDEVRLFQHSSSENHCKYALGFVELLNYIKGDISLEQAINEANSLTRKYAKRQRTWFRHHIALGPLVEKITHV